MTDTKGTASGPYGESTKDPEGDRAPTLPELVGQHGPLGLLEDTELVGEYQGSGYRKPPQLVSRPDGQLVRLPDLLYLVVKALEAESGDNTRGFAYESLTRVAQRVSEDADMRLTVKHIIFLIDRKLAPLGVTTYSDGTKPEVAKPTPFLSLRFRVAVLSGRATWRLGGLFSWLFQPSVLVVMLVAAAASEVFVWGTTSVGQAMTATLVSPSGILVVVALAVASTAFHEFGHATACRYSGVRPGSMGCGIYVVWPAFYTDITNTYRLDRAGRLRTDLGGVYFNGLFLIVLAIAYLYTGYPPLLVAFLSVNIEIVQQLLPTLRFDGYYIVADLLGIPDLFKYIGPILSRYLLRRPPHPRLQELKRWPQILVTAWVLAIVPAMAVQLGYIAAQLPDLVRADYAATRDLVARGSATSVVGMIAAGVQVLLLLLPVVGVVFILVQLARTALRLVRAPVSRVTGWMCGHLRERIWSSTQSRMATAGAAVVVTTLAAGAVLIWPREQTGPVERTRIAAEPFPPTAAGPLTPAPTALPPGSAPTIAHQPAVPSSAGNTSYGGDSARLDGRGGADKANDSANSEHRDGRPPSTSPVPRPTSPESPSPAPPVGSPAENPSPGGQPQPPGDGAEGCVLGIRLLDFLC